MPLRRLTLVALAVLLSTISPPPAHADDADGGRFTWSLAPASADGPDGRSRLEYLAEPGTRHRDHVVVRNLGTEPITVGLAVLDARQAPDNPFELLAPDELSTRVGAWVRLDETEVRVPAQESVVVGFTLDLPASAEPGDHAGGIVAVTTASSSDGSDVQLRVGTRAYVRVAGPVSAAIAAQTRGDFAAGPLLVAPGILNVTADLTNTGNVRLAPTATVTVTGLFGLWTRSVPLSDVAEILPGGSVSTTGELTGIPPLGPLWVTLELPRVDSWDQDVSPDVVLDSSTVTIWAAPWAAPLAVALAAAIGWLLWRRRARRPPAHQDDVVIPGSSPR